jgi:hypothetical protein
MMGGPKRHWTRGVATFVCGGGTGLSCTNILLLGPAVWSIEHIRTASFGEHRQHWVEAETIKC